MERWIYTILGRMTVVECDGTEKMQAAERSSAGHGSVGEFEMTKLSMPNS